MKKINFLLIILVIVLLVPQITLAAWWNPFSWGFWSKIFHNQTQEQKLIGGDKDSHGCLIAAGYSWCEVKNKCLRTWEEKCEADQTARPALSEVEGWKTYTNTQYGFEFKYPVDYTINDYTRDDGSSQISLKIKEENYYIGILTFEITKNNLDKYISDMEERSGWYEGVNSCENISSVIDKTENYIIAGLNARKITLNPCTNFGPIAVPSDKHTSKILLSKNNLSYIITISATSFLYGQDKNSSALLSTFKFIPVK